MNADELQRVANAAGADLPGVTFEHREDPNWETYKVAGKVFMLMTDLPGHLVVTLKADPDEAVVLREQHPEITPGYHMDKRHWISAAAGAGLEETLVRELVVDSYRRVVEKLPVAQRPSTPDSGA